ncbi:acyl-CoA N-acyltransferase [Gamsiella multidivaricata]|uniref:acyl-CoA N-acyltransferase n=1 Tax=Gamsiella multidivaricata TaxID=101098 RepID=UPI00221EBE69|nr:acyl-CoA N-acyltransferase [Gamsiella multidivaricata]KAI7822680.1 acyl-CoA N-acyltransferase [Gamsiella multidivaricata]
MSAGTTAPFTRETARCMGPYTLSEEPTGLYMTAVEFSDIPEMVRLLNINQDVYNGSALFQYPYLDTHARDRIQRAHDILTRTGINTHFALRLSPTTSSPLIGWAHLHFEHYNPPQHLPPVHPETGRPLRVAEIGYWLSPEHTGRGYAAKMARYLVHEIAFGEESNEGMGCDIVRAVSYVENMASRKVAERAGMELELETRAIWIPKLQTMRNVCCYAVHKDPATKSIVKENYDY